MMAISVSRDPLDILKEKTKKSYAAHQKAAHVLPGGVTANIKYFDPYPIFMEEAEGAWLKDIDGNHYVDYLLAYGALILGHGHHQITQAVIKQMVTKGTTIFGTPHELETQLAEKLIRLYPGVEQVRYTNSGTEAALLAVRLAYAYTNKFKIAKFEGHYHGGFDQVLMSVSPSLEQAGSASEPIAVPDSTGIDDYYAEHTLVLPFNDLEASEALLRKHAGELAAVVLEPVQAGFIPATKPFLRGIRDITEELGIVLIFDEVKTGFRVSLGGAQSVYEVTPDLTVLGKVLGGGFPVGAVGGKKEIMEFSSPHGKKDLFSMDGQSARKEVLFHSGTYNGHPSVLAAGLATIQVLEQEGQFDQLVRMTQKLQQGIESVLHYYQIPGQTVGMGSIFGLVISDEPVLNYRHLQKTNLSLRKELDYHLLSLGIYTKPLNRYSLSVAHGEDEIQTTIDAYETAVKRLKLRQ